MIKIISMILPRTTEFRLHNSSSYLGRGMPYPTPTGKSQTADQPKTDDQDYTYDLVSNFGGRENKLAVHNEGELPDPSIASKPSR